jgi:UDP:flavonoid glycosyltransferase YjiC (YdhE family)
VAPPAEASRLAEHDLFGRLATAAMLPGVTACMEAFRPDLVLREPCEYASAVVARRRGVPAAQVAISLAQAEAGALEVAGPALEAVEPGLVATLRGGIYLTSFPASLDPSPFDDTRRFGADRGPEPEPLPDWWPGDGAPLVYLTFGTVLGHMDRALEVFRTALDALSPLEARVLLTVGPAVDPAALGPVGPRVHRERWVDQERVLARADVVVCHGGSGTTFGALAAGRPVVVAPVFADQFENGRRLARAGAGLTLRPGPEDRDRPRRAFGPGDGPALTEAVRRVLDEPDFARAAATVAREMAGRPTAAQVLAGLA